MRSSPPGSVVIGAVVLLSTVLASCAYYNTYYLAKRYYDRATPATPYVIDKPDPAAVTNFNKSIDYSKKLIANYPKSKWVDDAYMLWARGLLGRDDPIGTMNMMRDFPTRYPQSSLKDEALFYLGVGGRKAHQHTEALAALDEFLHREPNSSLTVYALLERARVLMALDRPGDAAASASEALERYPKSPERDRAMLLRADALLAQGEYEQARSDYRSLGFRATSDDDRFDFLLKEADCLEAGRRYDEELALLRDAQSREQEPQAPTAPGGQAFMSNPASVDRWGQLNVRIGTAEVLAGRKEPALDAYRRVVNGMPRSLLAAEAQYRIGYAYEILTDDFETARAEYAKVQGISGGSAFVAPASQRQTNLQRLIQYRAGAGPDSVGKQAEAALMLAELYLFQLDKPERALEEYQKLSHDHPGTPYAGKALNAEAWVLRNKLHREADADSVLWTVVRQYPKTEAQVDARDYLERVGVEVPFDLIQLPESPSSAAPDTTRLTQPPAYTDSLGIHHPTTPTDSLRGLAHVAPSTLPPAAPAPSFEASAPTLSPGAGSSPAGAGVAAAGAGVGGAAGAGAAAAGAAAASPPRGNSGAGAASAGGATFPDAASWPDPPDGQHVAAADSLHRSAPAPGSVTPAARDTVPGH